MHGDRPWLTCSLGKALYVLYSLIYNLFFLVPEVGLTVVVAFFITKAAPKLLEKKDIQ